MRFEKDIKLVLSGEIIERLRICVDNASPNEACGLIFGNIKEIRNPAKQNDFFYHYIGKKFHCLESDKKSPVAFLIDNFDKLGEIYSEAYNKYHMNLVSIFHSHPGNSNYPSGVDERNMERLESYPFKHFKGVIWSIMAAKNDDLKAFMLLQGELIRIDIVIEASPP